MFFLLRENPSAKYSLERLIRARTVAIVKPIDATPKAPQGRQMEQTETAAAGRTHRIAVATSGDRVTFLLRPGKHHPDHVYVQVETGACLIDMVLESETLRKLALAFAGAANDAESQRAPK